MLQYLNNRSDSIIFTMHEQNHSKSVQNLPIPKRHSLSNQLLQKLKSLQFLQVNTHFSIIIIIHALKLFSIIHLMLSYLSIDSQPFALQIQNILSTMHSHITLYRCLQFFIYCLKGVKIAAIFIAIQGKQASLSYSIAKRVINHIIIISEADLLLTSLLLIVNLKENIIGFIISALVNIGLNIQLDNYTNRKLESYHSSQISSLVYRCIHIFLYFINSMLAYIGVASYYYIFNIIIGVFVFLWYLSSGITIYYHKRPKYFTMAFISFYLTFIYLLAEKIMLKTDIFEISHFAKYLLIVSCFLGFFFITSEKNKVQYRQITSLTQLAKNMKQIDLGCFDLVKGNTFDIDADNFLTGLMKYHLDSNCSNSKCYTNFSHYYDPMSKVRFNITEVSREKQSNLRFYLKCLYQQCLQSHSSRQLLLNYCQFLVDEYFDLYRINKVFAEIELYPLNLFDSLRLYRLKIAVKEEATALNRLIFDGQLEIEKIMKADETFHEVSQNINQYLTQSIDAWTTINQNLINLTQLRSTFKMIFSLLDSINQSWIPLGPYIALQKKWKYLRIGYSRFILNEKMRQRDLNDFDWLEEEHPSKDLFLELGAKGDKLFNRELLFDKNTMYLHTAIQNKSMYILRTNQKFEEISMYSCSQIKGAGVDEFLPEEIKQEHNKSVMAWLEKGQSNNEACYPVRFTELKTKDDTLIPVVKYFKILVNVQASKENYLHFVCMLKVNSKTKIFQEQASYYTAKNITHVANYFSDNGKKGELKIEDNPFLKEQYLKPKSTMQELSKIKRSIRVLITILVMMTVGLYFLSSIDANNLNNYSIQYINFLNLYRYPMAFGKNVLKTMLNVGNQTKAIDQINLQIIQITAFMSDQMTSKTIFNPSLNIPKMYYPFQNNSFNKGTGFNQIDLIYYMVSTIQSLNKLPANRTGQYFTNFNMYITPYENLINSTKIRFHDSFKDIFSSMVSNQAIFLLAQILIFVLGMTYISYEVYQYFKKTKDNIKTILEFNDEEVRKIIRYYTQLQLYLCNFSYQSLTQNVSRQISNISQIAQHIVRANEKRKKQISLNKKSKHIYQSKQEIMRTIKYIVVIAVLMGVVLATISSFEITNMIALNKIQSFEEDGFFFLKYFPATSVLGHAILEKYYSQVYPQEITFYPERYAESIIDLSLIARSEYIGSVLFPDSVYFQDQKNYLFGNPCIFNPSVLIDAQTSQAKCLTIYNKTFSLGITTFLRACEKQINDFLYGRLTLTSSQIDELTSALTLVAYYITDAIMTWSSELTTMIMDFNDQNAVLCFIICSVLLIFHLLSCQCILFPHLEEDYSFNKKVFEHMVPQQILISQKVIKQKFIINGILHQQ